MDIRVERKSRGNRTVLLGLYGEEIIFRIDLRKWVSTARYIGFEMGVPIVEIAELEILHSASNPTGVAFRALCEAFTLAIDVAEHDGTSFIAAVAEHPSVRRRLVRRAEFQQLGSYPWPFVAQVSEVVHLRTAICAHVQS